MSGSGRKCAVCCHPEREAIERLLVSGESLRNVAHYGMSTASLSRHANQHMPAILAKAEGAREVASGENLLGQLRKLQRDALDILERTKQDPRTLGTALQAIREASRLIELAAKISGEIATGVNITVSPEWVRLRTRILRVMEPFPEAMLRLAEVLHAN